MLNLNLMQINENYDYPSQLPDSLIDDSSAPHEEANPSIKAINLYELNRSISESGSDNQRQGVNGLEIVHSLDESSIQHDDFLQKLQLEQKVTLTNAFPTRSTLRSESDLLLVDRKKITLTLFQTQSARQLIAFTNPTANPIKIRFSDCPFQIQNDKMLGFVLAQQLEVIIQPWERVELAFAIQPKLQDYGDIIETIVVMAEFIGRAEQISPVSIQFHIRYISPKLTVNYEGTSDIVSLMEGKLTVLSLKANKIGQFVLRILLEQSVPKMEMLIESRGKLTVPMETLTLYGGQTAFLKLRQRGQRSLKTQERSGLMLRPVNTQICYVIGLNFLN